tara:strand:+ start:68 stop:520 length:453 start_codon:yes stop_codon:yes gene_type:complete
MTTDKISAKQQRCFHFLNLLYANKWDVGNLSGIQAMKKAKVGSMMLTMARQLGLVDEVSTHTPPKWLPDVPPTMEDVAEVRKLMSAYSAESKVKAAAQRANEVKPPQGTPVSIGALTNAMELARTRGQMKLCVDTLKLLAIEEHRLLRLI